MTHLPYPADPEKEARAMAQREANERALASGDPLPFPNVWDEWDPTKVPRDATPEQIRESYRAFRKICRPPRCKRYVL